jgi:ectoine hydroxylase-related dioxygenase (phytanoyl-CoA dioxygenase family)
MMKDGFVLVPGLLHRDRVNAALELIATIDRSDISVMKDSEVFAVRGICRSVPGLLSVVLVPQLRELIMHHCGKSAFLTKSIYFDKPASSNWFVAYHQDVSIAVKERHDMAGFSRWTAKHGAIGMVPPVRFLEHTLTVRIHFDDTDERNGALRVMPGSHRDGIRRGIVEGHGHEVVCCVEAGGAMLMRPLLFHTSGRSVDARPRRVLHLEFNTLDLPAPMRWAERMELPPS